MSQHEDSDSLALEGLAFEYVTGTLRGSERTHFIQKMRQQSELVDAVGYWEQRLMAQHAKTLERQPREDTWDKISARIAPLNTTAPSKSGLFSWLKSFGWQKAALAFSFVWAISVSLWLGYDNFTGGGYAPNSDYVAVLTDTTSNKPLLTALTAAKGKVLWLQWETGPEKSTARSDTSLQLWAQSRRDGQIRPLYVFDQRGTAEIQLDEATLRLIKDSEYLLLTEEEAGGSAIDEPSEVVLARGICIRLISETI